MVLKFLFNTAVRMLLLAALVYGAFFLPIGQYTFYRHAVRIGSTVEAQELWAGIASAFSGAKQQLTGMLGNRAAAQAREPAARD